MTVVTLLAVTISTPAAALSSTTELSRQASAPVNTQGVHVSASAQASTITRDGYTVEKVQETVEKVQEVAPGAYAATASTFVNDAAASIQWPFLVGVPISGGFGPRTAPCDGCSTFHKGMDMNPGVNTPIQAVASGTVVEISATDNGGLGVYAVIEHEVGGESFRSVYAHMTEGSLRLTPGQAITVGDIVGNVGNSGQSTGPHLHFEIHVNGEPIDPFAWLTARVGG
ncbi:hypothetical protein ASF62_11975 [Leifsonia sp. Leaf325]|nr:M23 family metallopeptidase [Leifsonia sp. Leaf325]KQQ92564.1 hypothetical protein ASF62_11975 [Leifsonia sp. Leaf325]